jgi:flagellar biosynthetic protein FliR
VLILFSLVLARVLGLFLGGPVFSTRALPGRFRLALAVMISLALLPTMGTPHLPEDGGAVAGAMAMEGLVGYGIGFLARLFLTGFQLAGGLISFQASFALASALDPITGARSSVIEGLHLNLATILFLIVDGHHLLLRALAASYGAFPLGGPDPLASLTPALFAETSSLFEHGVRLAAPVTGLLLLVNGIVGFLNRVMPQLSIFNIGFPMVVFTAITAMAFSIPELASAFLRSFGTLESTLATLVEG